MLCLRPRVQASGWTFRNVTEVRKAPNAQEDFTEECIPFAADEEVHEF